MLDLLLHLDETLRQVTLAHPTAAYALLFAVVFTETAFFPVAPFLPGDGLLFAVGVLCAGGLLSPVVAMLLLWLAAGLGAGAGYRLGRWAGPALFDRFPLLNRSHYERSHAFYVRHGPLALVVSRFLPIVKALVPFVAGAAGMAPGRFVRYNWLSAGAWVVSLVMLGYVLGRLPVIREHPSWVVLGLAAVALLAGAGGALVRLWRRGRGRGSSKSGA